MCLVVQFLPFFYGVSSGGDVGHLPLCPVVIVGASLTDTRDGGVGCECTLDDHASTSEGGVESTQNGTDRLHTAGHSTHAHRHGATALHKDRRMVLIGVTCAWWNCRSSVCM
jgi:hypothetical protein